MLRHGMMRTVCNVTSWHDSHLPDVDPMHMYILIHTHIHTHTHTYIYDRGPPLHLCCPGRLLTSRAVALIAQKKAEGEDEDGVIHVGDKRKDIWAATAQVRQGA